MIDPTDKQSIYRIVYHHKKEMATYLLRVYGDSPDDIAHLFSAPEIEIEKIELMRGPVKSND